MKNSTIHMPKIAQTSLFSDRLPVCGYGWNIMNNTEGTIS